ncbi:MAG: helix-turn-helix transcriptional regulator [Rhodococcus sp. (in: high G+C Gram-positive bacteria)]
MLTRRFDVRVAESGWVFGAKFRPGGFPSFTGTVARELRDVQATAPTAFHPDAVAALPELGPDVDADDCRSVMDDTCAPTPGRPNPTTRAFSSITATMLNDRSLIREAQLEERCGLGTRRVQRLFERYVGATPKWVLARYRMHDAVSDLDSGYRGTFTDLAARHGWFDQAHFTREFTELVGVPPGEYLK